MPTLFLTVLQQSLSKTSDEMTNMLYAHRSLAAALADIESVYSFTHSHKYFYVLLYFQSTKQFSEEAIHEIDRKALVILTKKKAQLEEFHKHIENMIQEIIAIIRKLTSLDPKKIMISDVLMWEVIRAMDKLILLNEIKSRKESSSNDLTHYSRFLSYHCLMRCLP